MLFRSLGARRRRRCRDSDSPVAGGLTRGQARHRPDAGHSGSAGLSTGAVGGHPHRHGRTGERADNVLKDRVFPGISSIFPRLRPLPGARGGKKGWGNPICPIECRPFWPIRILTARAVPCVGIPVDPGTGSTGLLIQAAGIGLVPAARAAMAISTGIVRQDSFAFT